MIHVFIGTKAQYIKTAPLLRRMDDQGVPYRLIDSGQHASLSVGLRDELGIREPDLRFGDQRDVVTIPQAILWSAKVAAHLVNGTKVRNEIFAGDADGICVVHGDTPSTLLSAMLARRAGLRVAHLEAGLRSGAWWDPFPEELIRIMVMRVAHILFSPDDVATSNLRKMRVRGQICQVSANTVVEALNESLGSTPPAPGSGPAIFTMHRVENLTNPARVQKFLRLLADAAKAGPVQFVMHGPTIETLRKTMVDGQGAQSFLDDAGVKTTELLEHADFTRALAAAPYVITDGGSIQEECALLGTPTALWRNRTERHDGLGRNVLFTHFDPLIAKQVIANPQTLRHDPLGRDSLPSEEILEVLRPFA